MKNKFVRFIFLAGLLAFIILFAGCQPISENADSGGTGGGASSGGNQPLGDGAPTDETPSNGDGYPPYSPSYNCNGTHTWVTVFEVVNGDDEYHIWVRCSQCGEISKEAHSFNGDICLKCRYNKQTREGPRDAASLDAQRPKTVPSDGNKLVYLIVSPNMFKDTLKTFVDFKTQQGFEVDEMYIDSSYSDISGMINSAIYIRTEIKNKYSGATKPTYILLVGDSTNMPTFKGTAYNAPIGGRGDDAPKDLYVADYFYSDFDGDYNYNSGKPSFSGNYVPESYIGRFSARTIVDLQNQINKTIKMSKGISENESALMNHIITQDPSSAYMDRAGVDFVKDYFTSSKTNSTHYNGGGSDAVIQKINSGVGTVTYYGHANPTYWQGNGIRTYSVGSLSNTIYPVVFSMACYTGTFDYGNYNNSGTDSPCLAEAFMRSPNGAVAFIGSSRESATPYIINYMAQPNSYYGILPSLFHSKGETDTAQFARTLGEAHYMGCMAIKGDSSYINKIAYLEMQIIFGDPSYTPYYTTPTKASLPEVADIKAKAGNNYRFTTAPKAIVAISQKASSSTEKAKVISVAVANDEGIVSINIPRAETNVVFTLNSSAPQYIDNAVEFNF